MCVGVIIIGDYLIINMTAVRLQFRYKIYTMNTEACMSHKSYVWEERIICMIYCLLNHRATHIYAVHRKIDDCRTLCLRN